MITAQQRFIAAQAMMQVSALQLAEPSPFETSEESLRAMMQFPRLQRIARKHGDALLETAWEQIRKDIQ